VYKTGVVLEYNFVQGGVVFQEVIKVFGNIENHRHHQKNTERKRKSAQVFLHDIPVDYAEIFMQKGSHYKRWPSRFTIIFFQL